MAKRKKKENKKNTRKYVFMIVAIFVLSLVVLSYPFFAPTSLTSTSLECSRNGDFITCSWKNCKYSADSDLTLAKVPDYAETVRIQKNSGSNSFAPNPIEGTYTAVLFCDNSNIIKRITVS